MSDDIHKTWAFKEGTSPYAGERALFLDRNLFTAPREITNLFGAALFCAPQERRMLSLKHITSAGFDRIVFGNPYGASDNRSIYHACREEGFPILVCERGMLPGTVMLDQSGFLADSVLFDPGLIERARLALPDQTFSDLRQRYLARPALESQKSESADLAGMETALQLASRNQRPKVLIVLQNSQDTAVRFFKYQNQDYSTFLRFAENLCETYASICDFTFKPHPSEPNASVAGARPVGHLNILDAIVDASHVLCFSSGVGLLSMLLERSVGYFGIPAYHQCPATQAVRNALDFDRFLQRDFADTRERAKDYLTYADAVYSHADFFGRHMNRFSNRDIYARYNRVRVASDKGVNEHTSDNISLLNSTWTWPLQAVSRAVQNRLGLGFHSFENK